MASNWFLFVLFCFAIGRPAKINYVQSLFLFLVCFALLFLFCFSIGRPTKRIYGHHLCFLFSFSIGRPTKRNYSPLYLF